jgi:hypothetical protein
MSRDFSMFHQALALALSLTPQERLQLVSEVVASVEREFMTPAPMPARHWGKEMVALLESLDTRDWQTPETEDAVAWLTALRENSLA